MADYDAILIVSFGGPERPEDVMPFLENVTRGRNVPRERLLVVAGHYHHCGGASPINGQVRDLIAALQAELDRAGVALPIYWGNRNWHPFLRDTIATMAADGVRRAVALVLSAYSSYSSCRQYIEDIERARAQVGPTAPMVEKARAFFNHPDFIAANIDRVRAALGSVAPERRADVQIAFTAHSIPVSMAENCKYERQLREASRLVAEGAGVGPERWSLVYQSRSGRPSDPWLGPDVLEHLRDLHAQGARDIVVHPIGFLSDHLEIVYDLDVEARALCEEIGLSMTRASSVGTHPRFVAMLRDLVEERTRRVPAAERRAVGALGPCADDCDADCCPAARRPSAVEGSSAIGSAPVRP